jgi:hypothetical protein
VSASLRIHRVSLRGVAVAVLLWTSFAGCSKAPEVKLVPAEGIVKIKGKPAANIMVTFLPDSPRTEKKRPINNVPSSSGISDDEGFFTLATAEGRNGAVIGPHKVMLVDMMEERAKQGEGSGSAPPRLSPKYCIVRPDSLTVEVTEENDLIVINISD